jgi:hypothetical protein
VNIIKKKVVKMNEDKKYFFGNEISSYGIKHNRVDYRTLAASFDAVLCNDITKLFYSTINNEYNEIEYYNGTDYNEEEDYYYDVYQYYIIDNNGADILQRYTDEIVYYLPAIDVYVWGVTHFGTSWDYVLTDIKIDKEGE